MNTDHKISRVDEDRCKKIAAILKRTGIRDSFYEREFISFNADRETKLRTYLFSVAICHQTRSLHHPELNLYGWDCIEHAFLDVMKSYSAFLNPGYLGIMDPVRLKECLLNVFSYGKDPSHCTLDRIDERSELLYDTVEKLLKKYGGSVSKMIDSSGGLLLNDGRGMYERLEELEAFSDPFRKKSSFFLKLAWDAGLIQVKDPENMDPIMDYHMQRVLMRMGCVEVTDQDYRDKLLRNDPVGSDKGVRGPAIEAVRLLCRDSGIHIWIMNDLLWSLGRSCCGKTTLCHEKVCIKSPCTFFTIADLDSHDECIFGEECRGGSDESYRSLMEPMVETHYY